MHVVYGDVDSALTLAMLHENRHLRQGSKQTPIPRKLHSMILLQFSKNRKREQSNYVDLKSLQEPQFGPS